MNIIEIKDQNSFFANKGKPLFNIFSKQLKPENYFESFKKYEKCYSWVVEENNYFVAGCNILYREKDKTWFVKDLYCINENKNKFFKKLLNHIILFNLSTKREFNTICHEFNDVNPFDYLQIPIKYKRIKLKHYTLSFNDYLNLKDKIDELLTFEIIKNPICSELKNHYYFKINNFNYENFNKENLYFLNKDAVLNFTTRELSSLDSQLEYYNISSSRAFFVNVYGEFENFEDLTIDYFIK